MFDRFTDSAREIMGLARQEAQRLRHQYIGTEHLLLGLIQEKRGIGANALRNLNVNLDDVQGQVEKIVMSGPEEAVINPGKMPFTTRAKKVLELAAGEPSAVKCGYIGTGHVLLGLVREGDGVAGQILLNLELTPEAIRAEVLDLIGFDPPSSPQQTEPATVTQYVAFEAPTGAFCPRCTQCSVEFLLYQGGGIKWRCSNSTCEGSKR